MSPIVAHGDPVVLPAAFLAGLRRDLREDLLAAIARWDRHRDAGPVGHHVQVVGREGISATVGNCGFCFVEREGMIEERA